MLCQNIPSTPKTHGDVNHICQSSLRMWRKRGELDTCSQWGESAKIPVSFLKHNKWLLVVYAMSLTVRVISKTFQYFIFYFVNFTWIGICFDWSEFSPVSSWYSIQNKANNYLLWDTELTDRKKGIFNRYHPFTSGQ